MRPGGVGSLGRLVADSVRMLVRALAMVACVRRARLRLTVRGPGADHAGCRDCAPNGQQQRQKQHQHGLRESHPVRLAHGLPGPSRLVPVQAHHGVDGAQL